ncbi:cupin domain-containing protein [Vibrio penaeicida]|uniref:cupin domain-containing protein n=1 Tax=Vibrio penaeicida TaxID=104609 RepID=UPI000CE9D8B6|nr:cupin domain-containing protein [Vibrio penaeicida]
MKNGLIKKQEIEQLKGTDKTHFLNKNAKRTNKSLGDLAGIKGFGFHIIEIQPGFESTEHHVHYFEDECVYVLEGRGTARIGDEELMIEVGDFIGYPAGGEAHSIINKSDVTLRCIVVGERLDHDVADYTWMKKRIYRNKGLPWNLVDLDNIDEPTGSVGQK